MNKWPTSKISDVCTKIAMGPFGSNIKVDNFVPTGVPVLNGANLTGFKLKEDSFNYVTERKAEELKNSLAYRGDIVVTHRGTLGQLVYIPSGSKFDKYLISQSQFLVRVNPDKADSRFVTYFFHSPYGQYLLLSNASQVGVPALARPTSTFKSLEIPLPPLRIQRKIADMLCLLDNKIELNAQLNQNLEAQAQAIFKSWFVDFEPFQNEKLIDSELGPIPKGWRVGTLSDIAEITMGQSPRGESYNENSYGVVFYQGRAEFSDRFPIRRLFTTEPKRMAAAGDVLLSVRAPVGDMNIANESCCIGRGLAAIHAKDDFTSFVFYTMRALKPELDKYNGEGTVFGCINKEALNAQKIIIPPISIFSEFEKKAQPMDHRYLIGVEENGRLMQLRDALLPKLISGEIDVSEIEV